MSSYTPEQAGSLLAEFMIHRESVYRRLNAVATLIDLDDAIRPLPAHFKRTIRKFISSSHSPAYEFDIFPPIEELKLLSIRLKEDGRVHEHHILNRTIKEIRVLRLVAQRLNVRKDRPAIHISADHRHAGRRCHSCSGTIHHNQSIIWKQDTGKIWHGYHFQVPSVDGLDLR